MRYVGIWYGGTGYGHSEATDAEAFESIAEAVEELRARYAGHGDFAYLYRERETWVGTPGVDRDSSFYLYRVDAGTDLGELREYLERDAYPDIVVEFGPRGGVRYSPA